VPDLPRRPAPRAAHPDAVLVANLAALVLTTLFNTEANRRFTYAGAGVPRRKVHLVLLRRRVFRNDNRKDEG